MIGATHRLFELLWRRRLRLFLGLLAVDAVFVILHAGRVRFDQPASDMWLLSRDRGYSELWQYGKETAIVGLLVSTFRRSRSSVELAWAATFAYFLVDDSLEVHETIGDVIADGLGFDQPLGIDGRDLGQVLVSGSVGLVLLSIIAVTTITDRSPARRLTATLLPVLAAIGFFGVVADVIDVIDIFGIVEDGGELVTMTAALALVVEHRRRRTGEPPPQSHVRVDADVTGDSAHPIESPDPSTS